MNRNNVVNAILVTVVVTFAFGMFVGVTFVRPMKQEAPFCRAMPGMTDVDVRSLCGEPNSKHPYQSAWWVQEEYVYAHTLVGFVDHQVVYVYLIRARL